MYRFKLPFIALFMLMVWPNTGQANQLVFVHSPGCLYCEMWRSEIGPIYHKTDEGKRLPLREVNLDRGLPADLKHLLYPAFTPTFIILDKDNNEIGRIVGYNEEFFWGFLQEEIKKLDAQTKG